MFDIDRERALNAKIAEIEALQSAAEAKLKPFSWKLTDFNLRTMILVPGEVVDFEARQLELDEIMDNIKPLEEHLVNLQKAKLLAQQEIADLFN